MGKVKNQLSMTKLDRERLIKKTSAEEGYLLDQLGQDSDAKAAPLVAEWFKEQEKKDLAQRDEDLEILRGFRNRKHYFRYLAQIMMRFASEEAIPKKYRIDVALSDKGVALKILGTKYVGAFCPSGLPPYDHYACKLMAVRLGNTIAKLEGFVRATEAGVLVPDAEDLKTYGSRPTN